MSCAEDPITKKWIPTPKNPADSPGEGWEWRGEGEPGSNEGSWFNPKTKESLHPDLNHSPPHGPHWDYKPSQGKDVPTYRVPPEGGYPTPK